MRKTGEHKCLFVRIAACDCDHPGGCNIITFPLYTCYCCYSSIQMPRTQAQGCTAPPCYQLWINILNEGKTTPEGDKKHLCCHSPTPAPSSGQRPAAGIQQMGPVPAARAALATYFILKGILFLFSPNKHNFCKKSLFVSALYHFQHLWDTCTTLPGSDTCDVLRDRCRCYREIPPPSKYICSRQPEPECVCQVQKFVGAGAGSICGPQLLGYRSLQRARDTWPGPGDQSISHMALTKHLARLELKVKSFNIISQSSITGTIWWFKDVSAPARHKFSGFDGNQLVMAGVQTKYNKGKNKKMIKKNT